MNIFQEFQLIIINVLSKINLKPIKEVDYSLINIEIPKDSKFGDLATNAALVLCKFYQTSPMQLAEVIVNELLRLNINIITEINIAKPGFINFKLSPLYWQKVLNQILSDKEKYGLQDAGKGKKINIEYVSANPTGPLHIGHGRGAVIGDVLANLYSFMGYSVTKEYYINDAGAQIDNLGGSLYFRYLEQLKQKAEQPKDFYPGEYLIDIAKELISKDGAKWLSEAKEKTLNYFTSYAVNYLLQVIKQDLAMLGIKHDVFTSEKLVSNEKTYQNLTEKLINKDLVYTGTLPPPKGVKNTLQDKEIDNTPLKLFRTSNFGDDIDRALEKKDGSLTYFAGDILYHYDKIQRQFDLMIDILGVDHKGYKKRLVAAVNALSNNKASLEIVFTELVNLLQNGKPLKMSKRAGTFVTLKEVLEQVNKDVFRFIMISRTDESVLDFDLSEVKEKSGENPVFYVQYAYARINSVLLKAKEIFSEVNNSEVLLSVDKSPLTDETEIDLLKTVVLYPKCLNHALQSNNVHLLYVMLVNIAKSIHVLWNKGKNNENLRFIIESNKNLTLSRLSLLVATKDIMLALFKIIGISNPERM